jgi:hypothetical protein
MVDFALSGGRRPYDFELADVIGMVAAYVDSGRPTDEIEQHMTRCLGPVLAADMERAFHMFNDWTERGLWMQGPAVEDVRFTDRSLRLHYPKVQQRWNEAFGD